MFSSSLILENCATEASANSGWKFMSKKDHNLGNWGLNLHLRARVEQLFNKLSAMSTTYSERLYVWGGGVQTVPTDIESLTTEGLHPM